MKTSLFTIALVSMLFVPTSDVAAQARGADRDTANQGGASDAANAEDGAVTTGSVRRSNRMEFDSRLVRGETAGTGAVVLFNRGARRLPELLERRSGFLRPTIEDVMGRRARPGESSDADEAAPTSAEAGANAEAAERAGSEARRPERARRRSRSRAASGGPARSDRPAARGGR